MSTKLVDRFKKTLKSLPKGEDAIVISHDESYKICEKINNEMKEYRRKFTQKGKRFSPRSFRNTVNFVVILYLYFIIVLKVYWYSYVCFCNYLKS